MTHGTSIQANLELHYLPYPEAVFKLEFFRQNPEPCTKQSFHQSPSKCASTIHSLMLYFAVYTLVKELYHGKYRPTISHAFIKLLADKGLLNTCFTQNIDTLEHRVGIPANKIVEAHGSFATQRCIDCHDPYPGKNIKRAIKESSIPRCDSCDGLVKPDIVFFEEDVSHIWLSS